MYDFFKTTTQIAPLGIFTKTYALGTPSTGFQGGEFSYIAFGELRIWALIDGSVNEYMQKAFSLEVASDPVNVDFDEYLVYPAAPSAFFSANLSDAGAGNMAFLLTITNLSAINPLDILGCSLKYERPFGISF